MHAAPGAPSRGRRSAHLPLHFLLARRPAGDTTAPDGASTPRRTRVVCHEFGRMPSENGQSALPDRSREDVKGTTYELFILLISILSIVNLVLLSIFSWGSQNWLLILYV